MKINIQIDDNCKETEVTITCAAMNDELEKVLANLRALDFKLTGIKNGQTFILDVSQIFYIETVDKKTFLYTESDIYETSMRLYELEQQLSASDFFRSGKSSIINFNKIKSLKSDIDGRIIVILENSERMIVSKQYAAYIKNKLGRS